MERALIVGVNINGEKKSSAARLSDPATAAFGM